MGKVINRKKVMDMETGEILDVIVFIPEKKDKDFVKVYKAYSNAVISSMNRLKNAIYVLTWIMDRLNFDTDTIYINPNTVAKDLNKSVRQIYRYIDTLVEEGFLFKDTKQKYIYRINTSYFYKGKVKKMDNIKIRDYVQVLE